MEIITPEWVYTNDAKGNFENIIAVKEQRRLGTSRGKTPIPQAPVIQVRIKADTPGLPENAAVRAELWNYGIASRGKTNPTLIPPKSVTEGEKFSKLRAEAYIACTQNIAEFGEPREDGYRYAAMSCFITRGARVMSRKFHIALKLQVVVPKEDKDLREAAAIESQQHVNGKWMSKTQSSKLVKPDHCNELVEKLVESISPIRTARMSISEKAMCPRECDQVKKVMNRMKNNGSLKPSSLVAIPPVTMVRKRKLSMDGPYYTAYMKKPHTIDAYKTDLSTIFPPPSALTHTPPLHPMHMDPDFLMKQLSVYPMGMLPPAATLPTATAQYPTVPPTFKMQPTMDTQKLMMPMVYPAPMNMNPVGQQFSLSAPIYHE